MIYREKLIELLDHATQIFRFDAWENTDKIADYLIANGVEIPVHCKDCIHFHMMEDGYHDCINIYGIDFPQPDDFCSYGEKNK